MSHPPQLFAVVNQATQYIEVAKASSQNGITVSEFGFLLTGLLKLIVSAIDSVPIEGVSKKEYVLSAVELLFDAVSDRMVPIYLKPLWLPLRGAVRLIVVAAAAGAIEQLLPLIRGVTK